MQPEARGHVAEWKSPYHFVGSLTTYCCSLHGWEGEIAFLVRKQRWKTGLSVQNLIFQEVSQSNTKVESLHRVKVIWSVALISTSAYLKVLIVKLIWIWNFLRQWPRMPSLPMNIHLAKPYWWFWVSLLPGHVWRLRWVLNYSCVQTLWDSTDTTYFACGIIGISFQAFETSFPYIKIHHICSFLGWVYLFASHSANTGSSHSHQLSTSQCRRTVQLNVL